MADTTSDVRPEKGGGASAEANIEVTEQATVRDGSSDGEGEKSARERLKKTSIAGLAQKVGGDAHGMEGIGVNEHTISEEENSSSGTRGRPAKKRSFEDLARDETEAGDEDGIAQQANPKRGQHKRMRSRDVADEDQAVSNYEGNVADAVQGEIDLDAQNSPGGPGVFLSAPSEEVATTSKDIDTTNAEHGTSLPAQLPQNSLDLRETPASVGESTGETASSIANPVSGFTNVSSKSPFGTIPEASKSPPSVADSEAKKTSATAFASSGLSTFANTEKSPFSTASKSTSGFGGGFSSGGFGSAAIKSEGSVFGTKSSGGFGGIAKGFGPASGFGSAKPFGSSISSFASTAAPTSAFGTGKLFGITSDKQDEEDGSDNGEDESGSKEEFDEQDERFAVQDVETGEEAEDTVFQCRAKLFHFEKEWKERGVGTIKVNVIETVTEEESTASQVDDEEQGGRHRQALTTERKSRLIMRTDGVHRVVLNTPIFKAMTVGQSDGSAPSGKTMHLTGLEAGKPVLFQIKIGKEDVLKDLYEKILSLRSEAKS